MAIVLSLSIITGIIGSGVIKRFPYRPNRIIIRDINIPFMLLNTSLILVMYLVYNTPASQIIYSLVSSILLIIAFLDARHMLIPNGLLYMATSLVVLEKIIRAYHYGLPFDPYLSLVSMMIPVVLFGLLYLLPGDGIGEGDILLGGLFGLILGMDRVVNMLLLAFVLFVIVSLIIINRRDKRVDIRLPFAPFMIAGFYIIQIMERVWG